MGYSNTNVYHNNLFANAMQYIYFILDLSLCNCVKVNNINRFKSCQVYIFTAPTHSCIPLPKTKINQHALKISVFRVLNCWSVYRRRRRRRHMACPIVFVCFFITNMLHILQIASTDNEFCCFTSSFRNESGRTKRTHQTPIFTNVCRPNTILASNTILEKISSKVPQSLYDSNQQFPPP